MKYFRIMVLILCGIIGSARGADVALLEQKLVVVKKLAENLSQELVHIAKAGKKSGSPSPEPGHMKEEEEAATGTATTLSPEPGQKEPIKKEDKTLSPEPGKKEPIKKEAAAGTATTLYTGDTQAYFKELDEMFNKYVK